MFRTGLHRRLIALVAAYGLALQALLVGAVAQSPGAMATSVICAGERTGGSQREVPAAPDHDVGCALCTLACADGAALPASPPTITPNDGYAAAMAQPYLARSIAHRVMRAGFARGPPA